MISEECRIVFGEHSTNVSECRDVKSWRTLYEADEIRQQRVLAREATENGLPNEIVKYAGRTHSLTKNSCIGLQMTLRSQLKIIHEEEVENTAMARVQ